MTLRSVQQLSAYAALACLIAVTFRAFQGLAGFDDAHFDSALLRDAYTLKILKFSLWQALLSTLLSVALAWPCARLLYRLNPKGTQQLLRLCLLAYCVYRHGSSKIRRIPSALSPPSKASIGLAFPLLPCSKIFAQYPFSIPL